tara:strand:+ start:157 stop:600 length:444 start_codon:yes stop_codon:yes gene_type:complete
MNAKTKTKDQTVADAISNLNANGSTLAPKMPDLKVSKQGGRKSGDVMYLPSELGKVPHSPQTAMTIYGYFHLCSERGLVAGEAWISKADINDVVIVSDRTDPVNPDNTLYTWKNWQTGEVLKDVYVQDTFAQYSANRKRYAVMAKQR